MSLEFSDVNLTGWILVAALAAVAVILFVLWRGRQKWTAGMLANAAICLALAFVLSYVRLFHMPQGGSVTAASMLPIMAFAYCYGTLPGLVVGIAYGFLQMIQDPWIVGAAQALLDYPLAFGCLALAGLARRLPEKYGWLAGLILAGAGRYICHVLSGVVFFAEYAEGTGLSPLAYSLGYNLTVFAELAICAVVMAIPQVRAALKRMGAK